MNNPFRRLMLRLASAASDVRVMTIDELLKYWDANEDAYGRGTTEALGLSPVAAAHRILTNSMASLPIDLYRKTGDRRENVPSHQSLYALTVRPNANMTPYMFKKVMESKCFWHGEAFAYIDRRRGAIHLIPLPDNPQLYEDDSGNRWYSFSAENGYQDVDLSRRFHEDELLHLYNETGDGRRGIGLLRMAKETIRMDRAAQKYAGKFYVNGARPSGIIEVPTKLNPENKDKIRNSFERAVGGENKFRVAVMDLGMRYTQLGISQRDAQFIESRQFTVEEIARFTGIPLHKLQSGKQSYESNQAQAIEYVTSTLMPRAVQWEEELRYKLLMPSERPSMYFKLNLAAEMRGDDDSRSQFYQRMIAYSVMTPNDARRLEDLNDDPNGDKLLATKNLTTLRSIVAGEPEGSDNDGGN